MFKDLIEAVEQYQVAKSKYIESQLNPATDYYDVDHAKDDVVEAERNIEAIFQQTVRDIIQAELRDRSNKDI